MAILYICTGRFRVQTHHTNTVYVLYICVQGDFSSFRCNYSEPNWERYVRACTAQQHYEIISSRECCPSQVDANLPTSRLWPATGKIHRQSQSRAPRPSITAVYPWITVTTQGLLWQRGCTTTQNSCIKKVGHVACPLCLQLGSATEPPMPPLHVFTTG
jgi:hypothetical protein